MLITRLESSTFECFLLGVIKILIPKLYGCDVDHLYNLLHDDCHNDHNRLHNDHCHIYDHHGHYHHHNDDHDNDHYDDNSNHFCHNDHHGHCYLYHFSSHRCWTFVSMSSFTLRKSFFTHSIYVQILSNCLVRRVLGSNFLSASIYFHSIGSLHCQAFLVFDMSKISWMMFCQ